MLLNKKLVLPMILFHWRSLLFSEISKSKSKNKLMDSLHMKNSLQICFKFKTRDFLVLCWNQWKDSKTFNCLARPNANHESQRFTVVLSISPMIVYGSQSLNLKTKWKGSPLQWYPYLLILQRVSKQGTALRHSFVVFITFLGTDVENFTVFKILDEVHHEKCQMKFA